MSKYDEKFYGLGDSPWMLEEVDPEFAKTLGKWMGVIEAYHRYEVHGMNNIPQEGRALVLVNHSFATYDIALLAHRIFVETGRAGCGLGDSKLFAFESLRNLMKKLRAQEASPGAGKFLLNQEQLVFLAPGGMREALRPSTEAAQITWGKRQGFVRLAIETQSPVILAACPNADRIFNIYPSAITKFLYKKLKLPFVIGRGVGPTPIPRPVKLDHYLSEPIAPPKVVAGHTDFEKSVNEFHDKLILKMEELLRLGYSEED